MHACRDWVGRGLALVLFGGLLLPVGEAGQPAGYVPVARPAALQAALGANLKVVRDWLDQDDLASAGQAAQGLALLARLYGYQDNGARWRGRTAALETAATRLATAARRKDAAASARALQECTDRLAALGRDQPQAVPPPDPQFRPFGPTRGWMLLLEGASVDAKSARTPQEMELLAAALAEQVQAVAHLRAEPRWRRWAGEVRDGALAAAATARTAGVEAGRRALKTVHARCEVCHQGYQR